MFFYFGLISFLLHRHRNSTKSDKEELWCFGWWFFHAWQRNYPIHFDLVLHKSQRKRAALSGIQVGWDPLFPFFFFISPHTQSICKEIKENAEQFWKTKKKFCWHIRTLLFPTFCSSHLTVLCIWQTQALLNRVYALSSNHRDSPQNFIFSLGNYFLRICFGDDRPFSILLVLLPQGIDMSGIISDLILAVPPTYHCSLKAVYLPTC